MTLDRTNVRTPTSTPTVTSTSDSDVLALAYNWLEQCKGTHQKCAELCRIGSFYPKLLVDLEPGGLPLGYWRLCRPSDGDVSGPYVTLSHRWGKPEPTKLTRASEASMLKGLPLKNLTQVFQDAARVAILLRARYLWVDSICIYQDPDRLDIQVEASRMAEIYGNALCNISALNANSKGIFVERDSKTCATSARVLLDANYGLGRDMVIEDSNTWPREVLDAPLARRGWVLQEQALAPRSIYFGQSQLLWSCPTTTLCETYPTGGQLGEPWVAIYAQFFEFTRSLTLVARNEEHNDLSELYSRIGAVDKPDDSVRERLSRDMSEDQRIFEEVRFAWKELVERYSARQLTEETDKLLAIGGITHRFQTIFRDEYMAGLWRGQFPENLLWTIIWGWSNDLELKCPKRSGNYTAPTWSWASVDGEIEFDESEVIHRYAVAHLHNMLIEPLYGNPLGMLKSGYLRLRAPILRLHQDLKRRWTFEPYCASREAETIIVPQFDEREDVLELPYTTLSGDNTGRTSRDLRCNYYALFLTAGVDTYRPEDDDSFLLEGLVIKPLNQEPVGQQSTASSNVQAFVRCGRFRKMLPFSSLGQKPTWMPEDWRLWLPSDTAKTVEARAKAKQTFTSEGEMFLDTVDLY